MESKADETRRRNAWMLSTGYFTKGKTKIQEKVNEFLDNLNIKYINEYNIQYYAVDNFLIDCGLFIEVMGDFWHCSPIEYNTIKYDRQKKVIARDKSKNTYIKKYYGVETLYLWENDINKYPDKCIALIKEYIKNNGILKDYNSFNYIYSNDELRMNDNIIFPFFKCSIEETKLLERIA